MSTKSVPVHVENGDGRIQITQTIEVIENKGMKQKDVKKAVGIVELYKEEIVNSWQMYFSK